MWLDAELNRDVETSRVVIGFYDNRTDIIDDSGCVLPRNMREIANSTSSHHLPHLPAPLRKDAPHHPDQSDITVFVSRRVPKSRRIISRRALGKTPDFVALGLDSSTSDRLTYRRAAATTRHIFLVYRIFHLSFFPKPCIDLPILLPPEGRVATVTRRGRWDAMGAANRSVASCRADERLVAHGEIVRS
ncbi:hypothetical protein [Bradyrhizobium oligotrophicum]|uniref:hypothetical protein n=1 Tax=Bradyrhizobium oligotrophicum TaxID=44255 RepID=UPI003EBED23C